MNKLRAVLVDRVETTDVSVVIDVTFRLPATG